MKKKILDFRILDEQENLRILMIQAVCGVNLLQNCPDFVILIQNKEAD